MEEVEEELSLLSELVNIEIGRREKRPLCSRCRRPRGVCWCGGVGGTAVGVKSKVVVLQHPHEQKRCLRTAPMLTAALPPSHCLLLRGKRFPLSRFPELAPILSSRQTILMYPGGAAVGVEGLARVGRGGQAPYNIVILDGTWQQAKSIYYNCPALHALPQVCLSGRYTSEYIIRTQPTQDALSTVETAALALAILEENWALYDPLVEPLRVLCRHQIQHGAVAHQSKEEMIISGRCRKPLGKRTYKKLRKCGARHSDALLASMVMSGAALGPQNTTSAPIASAGLDGDGDSDGDKDTVMAKDDYGKSRVEISESREEIGESREESGESRVEISESREEIGEFREESGESRVETGRSREGSGKSRVEVSESREEIGKSRVETGQSRVELGESRVKNDEFRAKLSQFGVKVGELREDDRFREKTSEFGEESEKYEENKGIRTESEKECKKENEEGEEIEEEKRNKRENDDRRGSKNWIKTGNEEKEEETVDNKKEREKEAENDDNEEEEKKRENDNRRGSKDGIKRGDEENEDKKETEIEAENDDKEEEEGNKREKDNRRGSKDEMKIRDRQKEEERKRGEAKEEKRENMIKVRNISSHVSYELR